MFSKKELENYADVLIWGLKEARKKTLKKGDVIRLFYEYPGLKLAEVVHRKLVVAGYNVVVKNSPSPIMEYDLYKNGGKNQLSFISDGTKEFFSTLAGSIFISAPETLTHLKDIDPAKMGISMVARKPFRKILEKNEETGLFGWTLCTYPTEELAKKAGLSIKEYSKQIVKACYLNKKSAVDEWIRIAKEGKVIKKRLNSLNVDYYRVESNSMDLKILLGENRKWMGISGHNIPSFELFTSPDWRGTEGVYYSNLPTYKSGNYVENIRLEFKKGSAIKIEAEKGDKFLKKMLSMDKGANKLGEFSLTDKRFSNISKFMADTLFDENFGGKQGNCHIAVGASYSDTFDGDPAKLTTTKKKSLGFNDSSLHWDLVNTEKKRVTAKLKGGKTITVYENGSFIL